MLWQNGKEWKTACWITYLISAAAAGAIVSRILPWLNMLLVLSAWIRFPSRLRLTSTSYRRSGVSLTPLGSRLLKKKRGAENRKGETETYNAAHPAASSGLLSANGAHRHAASSSLPSTSSLQEKPDPRGVSLHFSSPTRYKQATRGAWVS